MLARQASWKACIAIYILTGCTEQAKVIRLSSSVVLMNASYFCAHMSMHAQSASLLVCYTTLARSHNVF